MSRFGRSGQGGAASVMAVLAGSRLCGDSQGGAAPVPLRYGSHGASAFGRSCSGWAAHTPSKCGKAVWARSGRLGPAEKSWYVTVWPSWIGSEGMPRSVELHVPSRYGSHGRVRNGGRSRQSLVRHGMAVAVRLVLTRFGASCRVTFRHGVAVAVWIGPEWSVTVRHGNPIRK